VTRPSAPYALALAVLGTGAAGRALGADLSWRGLQPGVDYAAVEIGDETRTDRSLHVVRIDPTRARLVAVTASARDRRARTATEWCRQESLAVAINMGMYRADHLTNVGHAHGSAHVNNAHWAKSYKSALAFDPKDAHDSAALIVDLDTPGAAQRLAGYRNVIQNLRLIRSPGRGVWASQNRRWSESAVAIDAGGSVLFLFVRRPFSMKELCDRLLGLELRIRAAMHVEGGPEASLSIHVDGLDLDLSGSYETGFNENEDAQAQWPIPNVLGVVRQ
jgi:hypothetical protein